VKLKAIFTIAAITLLVEAASASASTERGGDLHVVKDCSQYSRAAGGFCTITSSNVTEIGVGSTVFYDQAPNIPKGLLDSNVVLDAGSGNRAVGRCTLDLSTLHGLCTFADGTGNLAGFSARINVACVAPNATPCRWDGTYRFRSVP
jgi:hypothetical protein